MSAPSISTAEAVLKVLPGVECLGDGTVLVDNRVVARLGTQAVTDATAFAAVAVDAGPRWLAEKICLQGRCAALRLRPRPGQLRRAWRFCRGDSREHEAMLAARWHAPGFHRMPWGTVSVGIDPALRGAAVVLFKTNGTLDSLPVPAAAFWRRRTPAEARGLVAAALAAAQPWAVLPASLVLPGHWELPVGEAGVALADGWASSLPPGFEWREGYGQWRARGEAGGWRFTLGFTDHAGAPRLRWLLARLAIDDSGPWDPILERHLHAAQRRWAQAHFARGVPCRAFNDAVAKTGAELLVEWPTEELDERNPAKPQPAAER